MFTGIIKAMGEVRAMESRGGDLRLSVGSSGLPFADYDPGESIAVNGVCLTAVALRDDGFDTDVSLETLGATGLGALRPGDAVNLEPSLAVGDRLGGHFVSGHVDCVGTVRSREADGRSIRLRIEIPAEYARYVARKGSVTVDGVSLTVNDVAADTFDVNVIPHTADVTIIGAYAAGSKVNIEVDLLARYIERLTSTGGGEMTHEFLEEHGYG